MKLTERIQQEISDRSENWERFRGVLSEEEAEAWASRQPRHREQLLRAIWACSKEGLPMNETNIWKKVIEEVGDDPMRQIMLLDGFRRPRCETSCCRSA